MKYFLDTEFHEYKKTSLFNRRGVDTIELISIGIVSEQLTDPDPHNSIAEDLNRPNREYYAVCNEFDLKAAWNNKWLRENVLIPLITDVIKGYHGAARNFAMGYYAHTFKGFKRVINYVGKSKQQIAEEVLGFCSSGYFDKTDFGFNDRKKYTLYGDFQPQFYAYYADYDWVVLCWLYGRMIDLPNGFPMYCIDLKQELDSKLKSAWKERGLFDQRGEFYIEYALRWCKLQENYPKQESEHNALDDAKWNKKLYEFIQTLEEK